MAELGSIFEEDPRPGGRDLRAEIPFRRKDLGAPTGVQVPLLLPLDGVLVRRAIGPGEADATITVNLPRNLPDQATLRMRGLGEEVEDGPAGDLYLAITLTDIAAPTRPPGGWVLAGVVFAVALLAMAFMR